MHRVRTNVRALAFVSAVAAASGASHAVLLAGAPGVSAQTGATVSVNLVDSVGREWFDAIGDRTVVLSRIEGINPATAEGQRQLSELDVPALLAAGTTFPEVSRATTVDGQAQLTGLPAGVYYLEVLDNPDTRDARVSYAPMVVALTPNQQDVNVSPKAQVLGIAADSATACNTPAWKDAAAPGTYVQYDFTASTPNVGTDGTIGTYAITLDFSAGHTVQWKDSQPATVIEAAARGGAPLTFDAVAASQRIVLAQEQESWWSKLTGRTRDRGGVVKLDSPRVTMRGAGTSRELTAGADYTVSVSGNDTATFELTPAARAELAKLRASDPATTVEIHVPARANTTGPWGTVKRGEVIGTLETSATLHTDGMDAQRTAVEVRKSGFVNVVNRESCFQDGGSATDTAVPPAEGGEAATGAPRTTAQTPGGAPDGSRDGSPDRDASAEGSRGGDGTSQSGGRSGLASTGAGVLGIVALALALILLGLWLRRRRPTDEGTAE